MRDVVRSILVTYKEDRESRDLTPADLDDLMILIRPEIRRKQIVLTWSSQLPQRTAVNAFGIRQVMLNLLLNACKASPRGGAVSFAARVTPVALEIEVSDAGPGLPTHVAEFLAGNESSTSGVVSSGLGLWVTKRIIKEMGGAVTAGKSPHGGARFRVVIPMAPEIAREVERVA